MGICNVAARAGGILAPLVILLVSIMFYTHQIILICLLEVTLLPFCNPQ